MWICTQHGYYSAVADKDEPMNEGIWVRARAYEDLVNLRELGFDIGPIKAMKMSDYPYRVFMPRSEWARYLTEEAFSVDYPNFKNRVKEVDKKRSHIYMDVWYAMTAIENDDYNRSRVNEVNAAESGDHPVFAGESR